MKVLYCQCTHELLGGSDRSLFDIVAGMVGEGKDIECAVLLRNGDPYADQYRSKGIAVFHIPWRGPPNDLLSLRFLMFVLTFLPYLWFTRKVIKQSGADLVHVNTSNNLVCGLAAWLCAKPVVWHLRECNDGALFTLAWRLVDVLSVRVIAISDIVERHYMKVNPGSRKCSRVYNGIEAVDLKVREKTNGYFDIILPARIDPCKGHFSLLMALTHLPESLLAKTRVGFVGAVATGAEDYLEALRLYIRQNQLSDVVGFNGFSDCIEEEIARADVLVQCSSLPEAFGRTVLEAMLVSTVVVATDNGAAVEILDHGRHGFLYRAGDSGDLARQLVEVSEMPTEKVLKITQAARNRALEEFSMARVIDGVLSVYAEVEECNR